MTRKKKPARKRSSASSPLLRRARGFPRALVVSAIAAFSIASCALNPQWRETASLDAVLAHFGIELPASTGSVPAPYTGAQVKTQFAECPDFFPARQAPIVPAGQALRELCFSAFAILHSGQTKTPVFVAQRLDRRMLTQAGDIPRTDRFFADARLPRAERAELADYRGSGYSRGHMAPAGDMHTHDAMAQSFSLANMVPQDQRHNAGAWSRIEQDTRKYVMRAQGDVYVFTGPVYPDRPERIGDGGVAVPSHIYKVVYDAVTGRSWVHWQANNPDTQAGTPITYDEFVRRTGLRLLPTH